MTWQDVAAVLYAQCALEETLHQVAPGSEEHHDDAKAYPAGDAQAMSLSVIGDVTDDEGGDDDEDASADATFPTLARTDARKELVLAEERTAAVSTSVVGPEEDEDAQRRSESVHRRQSTRMPAR